MRKWTKISLLLQLLPITLWGQDTHALYTARNNEILDIIAQLPARAPQILDIPCISPVQQPNFDRVRISSGYGLRIHPITQKIHQHSGIDIPPSGNDTIYAAANGIIDTVAYNDLIGLHIKIRHKYGFKTTYGHLKRTFIRSPRQKNTYRRSDWHNGNLRPQYGKAFTLYRPKERTNSPAPSLLLSLYQHKRALNQALLVLLLILFLP